METGLKTECLRSLSFGNQVAEEERDSLRDYFVRTQAWDRIRNGEVDIIYGPKGSGKSALYVLVQQHAFELSEDGIALIAGENPRGAPAFRDLATDPPATEREFISIWKLYFILLLAQALVQFGIANDHAKNIQRILDENGILPTEKTTLGAMLSTVRKYVERVFRPRQIEGGVVVEPTTGLPTAFTGKIVFEDPDIQAQKYGIISADEILQEIDSALKHAGLKVWLMLDRLDVAFDESSDLERNALRALFRAYRDLRTFDHITPKIFLRSDIWKRITEDGFREATHMSRDIRLEWDKATLRNLVVRRLLNNATVVKAYGIDKNLALSSAAKQDEVFDLVFPAQVEVGEKQSTTFDWILRRTVDGTGSIQPRDVIVFLNLLVEAQNRRLERGEPEPAGTALFDRSAFKEVMPALSEIKVTRVLFAEYPQLRPFIDALRETKTEHNVESLARIWNLAEDKASVIARTLRDVGFFEERTSGGEPSFWVPFIYRSYLSMSQGKVEEMQGPYTNPLAAKWFEDLVHATMSKGEIIITPAADEPPPENR